MRILWLSAALVCGGLGLLGLRGLVGEIYLAAASTKKPQMPHGTLPEQALIVATRASPWMSEIWLHRAYHAARRGNHSQMLAYSHEALRWAPADARIWMNHAQSLIYAGAWGKDLEHSLRRVQSLAPSSPHLHLNKALLGIQIWRDAPDFLRNDTLFSAQFILKHQPGAFHRRLTDERLEFVACTVVGDALKLNPWCKLIQRERQQCDRPNLEPALLRRCQKLGLR